MRTEVSTRDTVPLEPEQSPSPRPRRAAAVGLALLVYLAASGAMFGLPVLRDPSRTYLGLGVRRLGTGYTDPSIFMWSLVWWPHAIRDHLDPFFPRVVWTPVGFNLAWAATAPGAALLAWPLTARLGPVATYSLLMLAAPALAAWAAFLLSFELTGSVPASLLGGYLFGFSTYELAQMTTHLNLTLVFPLPLAAFLVARRLQGRLRPVPYALLLALVVLLQLSFSIEVLLTAALFGGVAFLLGLALAPSHRRALVQTAAWSALAFLLAGGAAFPYLLALLRGPAFRVPLSWPARYSSDLVAFVAPTRVTLLGFRAFSRLTARFTAGLPEEGAYLGPVLAVVGMYALSQGRTALGRVLLGTFAAAAVTSLGPVLRVAGIPTVRLPWSLAVRVPVLTDALPARFVVYAWLAASVMAAQWLAQPGPARARLARWGLAAACVALLFPNLRLPLWRADATTPRFFATAAYRRYLPRHGSTLVLPFGHRGFSMLWQAETGVAFPMAGGYLSCQVPRPYLRWPILRTLLRGRPVRHPARQLRGFLQWAGVRAIVVGPGWRGPRRLFALLHLRPLRVGGVVLYRVPPRALRGPAARPSRLPSRRRRRPRVCA